MGVWKQAVFPASALAQVSPSLELAARVGPCNFLAVARS